MFTRILNKKVSFSFNKIDLNNTNFREASAVDTFYRQKGVCSDNGKDCVHFCDPIDVLFNQERLKRLGFDGVENYVKSLFHDNNSQMAELRKQCSDEDLLATIKSRHLQSPSDILAWTRYMSNNMDEFKSKVEAVKAEIAEKQKQVEQQTKETAAAE